MGIDVGDEWGKLARTSGVLAVGGAAVGALAVVLAVLVLDLVPRSFSTRALAVTFVVGLLCGAGAGRVAMSLCGFCGEILLIPVTAGALASFVTGFGLRAPLGAAEEQLVLMAVVWWAMAFWFGGAFVVVSERWR